MPSAPVLTVFSLVRLAVLKLHTAVERKKCYRLYHTFFTAFSLWDFGYQSCSKTQQFDIKTYIKTKRLK